MSGTTQKPQKSQETQLEGVLAVLKPAGFTSHDVVAKTRRILGLKRIGHTGTLDPQVTGVLPLCLGRATRVVEYIQELPKEYVAELTIGYATDTEDWTGQVTGRVDRVELDPEELRRTLDRFVGEIEQVPPMYSAVRVDGKRLYELARQGQEVERKPRKVRIYELELLEAKLEADHPTVRLRVLCSKGTYIRTLCVDIGRALGYPAVMSELTRTSTGLLTLEDCLTFEEIETLHREGRLTERLIPADQALKHLPVYTATEQEALHASQGKTLSTRGRELQPGENASTAGSAPSDGLVRLYAPDGRFIGLFRNDPGLQQLQPEKVFG